MRGPGWRGCRTKRTSIVNVGEVFYRLAKGTGSHESNRKRASAWKAAVPSLPVQVVGVTDRQVWDAADLKARASLSYADGFAASLAKSYEAALVTGDDDFKQIRDLEIMWLKRDPNRARI